MNNEWEKLCKSAEQAVNQGSYTKAAHLWCAAVSMAVQLPEDFRITSISLAGMAETHFIIGKYDIAEQCYKQLATLNEQFFGSCDVNAGRALNQLARFYFLTGKLAQSLEIVERVVEIYVLQLGHAHAETITAMRNVGVLYEHLGKYEHAHLVYSNALRISDAAWGTYNATSADLMERLGNLPLKGVMMQDYNDMPVPYADAGTVMTHAMYR